MDAKEGDLLLLVADEKDIALSALGQLRIEIAKSKNMVDNDKIHFLWVTDFPLLKYNKDEKRWESEHHPFTSCKDEDVKYLDSGDFKKIHARSYDLVINGIEIASGSIRIHSRKLQEKIFKTIGLTSQSAESRFGFLMEAFQYGAPPHGGIALGMDRFITLFTKSDTIRDVIAFPKTQKGICLMTNAPSDVDEAQLKELHIRTAK
jgi:aspartyl-tRNA synthetase